MFKNVVILCIDSLRVDGINYNRDLIYGKGNHKPIKTPNLDKFAKEGTSFLNAYSTNTYTTAAHASLFTGQYPPVHGIRAFFDFKQKLNPKTKTLAEELNDHNFQTFFYSDIKELFSEMDIWRGFKIKTWERMDWLWDSIADLKKDRNFIFIHTFDVHEPYLFIEDKSENEKINEDYFDAISDIRKKLKITSKLNQRKTPHKSWQEIRRFLNKNLLNEKKILYKYYLNGIRKFDKLSYPKIISKLNDLGLSSKNSLILLLSDHGEGATQFDRLNETFGHAGELTNEVVKIFFSTNTNEKKSKNKLISIKNIRAYITLNLINKKKHQWNNESLYLEHWDNMKSVFDFGGRIKIDKIKKDDLFFFLKERAIVEKKEKFLLYGNQETIIHSLINHKKLIKEFPDIFWRLPQKKDIVCLKSIYKFSKLSKKKLDIAKYINLLFDIQEFQSKNQCKIYSNIINESGKKTIFKKKIALAEKIFKINTQKKRKTLKHASYKNALKILTQKIAQRK